MTDYETLEGRFLVSISDFGKEDVEYLFHIADAILKLEEEKTLPKVLASKILTCLFYEPSTRTSSSFIAAMQKLGGSVIPITQGVEFSSVAKGESLHDTVRTLAQYSDVIAIRHPVNGSAAVALKAAMLDRVPVINAGDGSGEHPTQALADLYTIQRRFGSPDGLTVALVGDLKHSRTVHSLIKLLCKQEEMKFLAVAPTELQLTDELKQHILDKGHTLEVCNKLKLVIDEADIFYFTRPQYERWTQGAPAGLVEQKIPENITDFYLDLDLTKKMKSDAIIMHPFPRLKEIHTDVDTNKRATYFEQIKNGLIVRMALLAGILGCESQIIKDGFND